MSQKLPMSFPKRLYRILSGFELAVICLSLLFVLTFFGTIEQKWNGLYATTEKYFDLKSFFVVPSLPNGKIIPLPLPGAYWVMVVLGINMFLGGLIRARKGWRKAGVLVSHFAILFMLVAGVVSSLAKREGIMLVFEDEKSDFAQSYHDFDLEVFPYDDNGDRQAPIIVETKELKKLDPEDVLKVELEGLPVNLEIDSYQQYSNIVPAKQITKQEAEIVDGFAIIPEERNLKSEELNYPGCYITVTDKAGKPIQRIIVSAANIALREGNTVPVTFSYEGVKYGVSLHKKVWPMPFEVDLHKAVGEYHPNTQIPSWFQSNITKVTDRSEEHYKIVMNEPARHGGFTFFQARWSDQGHKPNSAFAVVKNPSDKWPEWALYVSTIALAVHFIVMLFIYASGSRRKKSTPAS